MDIPNRENHESGRDYALRVIKNNIINLELEPGKLVSENALAAELGLSRGPVREALIDLSKVKIVEVYPQRGSIIALVDYDLVDEARFMRAALENAVVERCAQNGLPKESLSELRSNLKLQKFFLEERNNARFMELDNEFHRLLFVNANAPQIHALMNGLLVHFDRVRAMALSSVKDVKLVEDHMAILEAIAGRDAEEAKSLMNKHLSRYKVDEEAVRAKYPNYLK